MKSTRTHRHVARLDPDTEVVHPIGPGRGVYAYLIEGAAFGGEELSTGDAAEVTDPDALRIRATQTSELILVDVPMHFEPVGIWRDRI